MLINQHEFSSIPQLHTEPPLRKKDSSRDPRNAHVLGINEAARLAERAGTDTTQWVPFDLPDDGNIPSEDEVARRRKGLIRLNVNYRTEEGSSMR